MEEAAQLQGQNVYHSSNVFQWEETSLRLVESSPETTNHNNTRVPSLSGRVLGLSRLGTLVSQIRYLVNDDQEPHDEDISCVVVGDCVVGGLL